LYKSDTFPSLCACQTAQVIVTENAIPVTENQTQVTETASVLNSSVVGFCPCPQNPNFLMGFAKTDGVTFRGRSYKRLMTDVSEIKRTYRKELSGASFTLSNSTFEIDIEDGESLDGAILRWLKNGG